MCRYDGLDVYGPVSAGPRALADRLACRFQPWLVIGLGLVIGAEWKRRRCGSADPKSQQLKGCRELVDAYRIRWADSSPIPREGPPTPSDPIQVPRSIRSVSAA
jgi:hypothetical protein